MPNVPEFYMPVPLYRFRVMFNDGWCIDVIAPGDSSTMREFALRQHQPGFSIAGVANIGLATVTKEVPPE